MLWMNDAAKPLASITPIQTVSPAFDAPLHGKEVGKQISFANASSFEALNKDSAATFMYAGSATYASRNLNACLVASTHK